MPKFDRLAKALRPLLILGEIKLNEYETRKQQLTGDRASSYEFAKRNRLGDDEAERIYLKVGVLATEEELLTEATLRTPGMKMPIEKVRKL